MARKEKELMNTDQVADRLKLSTGRVRQLAIDGLLKGQRIGSDTRGVWVFRVEDVEEFARTRPPRGRPRRKA
jgi:hypothetical protein